MAYRDTLFQLGMDLTRSSTAQKEDYGRAALVVQRVKSEQRTGEASSAVTPRVGISTSSQHLDIDLLGAHRLDSVEHVENTLKRAADLAGTSLTHFHFHWLAITGGVSGIASFGDSHVSIRNWPESGLVELDVLVSHDTSPRGLVEAMRQAFSAADVVVKEQARSEKPAAIRWHVNESRKPARVRRAKAA